MPINGTKREFSDFNINRSPERPGVYALYEYNTLTYYGSSTVSVRSRLRRHKSGKEGRCTQGASHFAYELTNNPVARETQLLEEYKRAMGRLPRCNDKVT